VKYVAVEVNGKGERGREREGEGEVGREGDK